MKNNITVKIALIVSVLLLAAPAFADEQKKKRGTPAQAQAMVAKAVALFEKEGMKAAFDRFTNRPGAEFNHLDLYIFVLRAEKGARIVSHAQSRLLIGTNASTLIDPGGLSIGRAILDKVKPEGVWVDYGWKDPLTGKVAPKSSWVVLHKGYIFGCGVHKP
ncbi:MAG: cache domain-containing protein [Nitrospinae bacterium]|nr:cache domain-containing protein [Nitrospinota bacterium]